MYFYATSSGDRCSAVFAHMQLDQNCTKRLPVCQNENVAFYRLGIAYAANVGKIAADVDGHVRDCR